MLYSQRIKRRIANYERYPPRLNLVRSKLKLKLLAHKLGIPAPELYWAGPASTLDLDLLPDPVVVKPDWGTFSHNVLPIRGGVNQFTLKPADTSVYKPQELILAEEYIPSADPRVPIDYKVYAIGPHTPVLHVINRCDMTHAWFAPDWTPKSPLYEFTYARLVPHAQFRRLENLEDMLRDASRVSEFIGTFVRVDMYQGPASHLFGEITTTPTRKTNIHPGPDKELGDLWGLVFGDAL